MYVYVYRCTCEATSTTTTATGSSQMASVRSCWAPTADASCRSPTQMLMSG